MGRVVDTAYYAIDLCQRVWAYFFFPQYLSTFWPASLPATILFLNFLYNALNVAKSIAPPTFTALLPHALIIDHILRPSYPPIIVRLSNSAEAECRGRWYRWGGSLRLGS